MLNSHGIEPRDLVDRHGLEELLDRTGQRWNWHTSSIGAPGPSNATSYCIRHERRPSIASPFLDLVNSVRRVSITVVEKGGKGEQRDFEIRARIHCAGHELDPLRWMDSKLKLHLSVSSIEGESRAPGRSHAHAPLAVWTLDSARIAIADANVNTGGVLLNPESLNPEYWVLGGGWWRRGEKEERRGEEERSLLAFRGDSCTP
ncbi:hypothetical protein BDN71DRAFT_1434882 [Pleurotus eryngii]|uniref:Uncharacterized protein n=1 Tax=Pleurotus eryngii TaxID=5323 RepID=A0A9P6D2M3_PLEER|nr:hypothetical protein BDN71DRAFT_1434882 [Pleurotus eryngii]